MIDFSTNLDVADRLILNYIIHNEEGYELFDEMNNELDRSKVLNLINPSFFLNPLSQNIFKVILSFLKQHKKIPNVQEIIKKADFDMYDIGEEQISGFFSVEMRDYTPDFVFKYLEAFVIRGQLNQRLVRINTKLKTEEITIDNIKDNLEFVKTEINSLDLEFTDKSRGLDIDNPESHVQVDRKLRSTGFEYLDIVLGGWEPKTLVVFQGRPKVGKSIVLANIAVRGAEQNLRVAVVTVELGDSKYIKRLGSNLYDVPASMYDDLDELNLKVALTQAIAKKKKEKGEIGKIHVKEYPTSGISAMEIETYLQGIEKLKGESFDLVVVDYINLLNSSNKKNDDNLYRKVKTIAEDLRRIAQRNKWTVVTATQVKLAYYNSTDMDLGSSAESSGLVATLDALFALISPMTMDPPIAVENTELLFDHNFMKFQCIANRDGGNMGSWAWFTKNIRYFRLEEVKSPFASYYPDVDGRIDAEENAAITDFMNMKNEVTGHSTPIDISPVQAMPDPTAGFNMPTLDKNALADMDRKMQIVKDETIATKPVSPTVEIADLVNILRNDG